LKGLLVDGSRFLLLPGRSPNPVLIRLIDIPERAAGVLTPCEIPLSPEMDVSSPARLVREIEKWIDNQLRGHRGKDSPLTDMDEIRRNLPDENSGTYLDEAWLLEQLNRRVKGQSAALETLAMVVTRHCARTKPSRPAVLFAVGPSGVGKTHTAESLAKVLSDLPQDDAGYQYLRLDMTEYQEAHRVSQLLGSPQGYVGHGEGSQLTDALRANPRTIVLFDEIEKAHPSILKVLMNAMDAGRLSTASRTGTGHEIDCTKSIFMFTSNLDAKAILDELNAKGSDIERKAIDEVCRRRLKASGIAPEIIGRIGRFLVYQPLSQEVRAEIITVSIADVASEYGVAISFVDPDVVVSFLERSGGGDFGIRPEKYLIDDELGGLFAEASKNGVKNIRIVGPPYYYEAV